jgi:hypothetical protein
LRNTTVEIPIQATREIPFSHKLDPVAGAFRKSARMKKRKKIVTYQMKLFLEE